MNELTDIKILIVEDDVYFRRVLEKRLKSEGYKVLVATDGREGMKLIVAEDPDLVISDWMMPHVDGLELCQSVKTGLGSSAPYFILLTARGEISDRLLALETGADDYLVKPCDQGELMTRVRAGLRNVKLTREVRRMERQLESAQSQLGSVQREVHSLLKMIPRCPVCAKVESDNGVRMELERYLEEQVRLGFQADPCPSCRAAKDADPDGDRAAA